MNTHKIKVCHFTSVHSSRDRRIFEKECSSLSKANYDVTLIAPNSTTEVLNGIKIIGVKSISKNRIYRMLVLTRKIYKVALLLDADIYHFHDPELIKFGLKLKKKGKKVIFDSHEDIFENISEKAYIPVLIRPFISFIINKFQKIALKKFDAIISITPHICEKIRLINENTVMITNYPILKNCDTSKEPFKKNQLIFAGGISEQWCHEMIINSLEKCPGTKYVLCGIGDNKYLNRLSKLNYWSSVIYKGYVSTKEVEEELVSSKAGMALLTYNKNVGNNIGTLGNTKLFEYMMAGIPIICTNFILWEEIISKYKCGICVNPLNIYEVTNAINYLINNPKIAFEMGSNAKTAYINEFNWNSQEKLLLNLYKNI